MKEEPTKGKTFTEFSEGLTSLKLKKNRSNSKQHIQESTVTPPLKEQAGDTQETTGDTKASSFMELEKLLNQLKNQNTTLKEDVSAKINVNNNININFNSNINIQANTPHKDNEKENAGQIIPSSNMASKTNSGNNCTILSNLNMNFSDTKSDAKLMTMDVDKDKDYSGKIQCSKNRTQDFDEIPEVILSSSIEDKTKDRTKQEAAINVGGTAQGKVDEILNMSRGSSSSKKGGRLLPPLDDKSKPKKNIDELTFASPNPHTEDIKPPLATPDPGIVPINVFPNDILSFRKDMNSIPSLTNSANKKTIPEEKQMREDLELFGDFFPDKPGESVNKNFTKKTTAKWKSDQNERESWKDHDNEDDDIINLFDIKGNVNSTNDDKNHHENISDNIFVDTKKTKENINLTAKQGPKKLEQNIRESDEFDYDYDSPIIQTKEKIKEEKTIKATTDGNNTENPTSKTISQKVHDIVSKDVPATKKGSVTSNIYPNQEECINGNGPNQRDSSQINSSSGNFNPEDIVVFPSQNDLKTVSEEPKARLMENILSNEKHVINSNIREPPVDFKLESAQQIKTGIHEKKETDQVDKVKPQVVKRQNDKIIEDDRSPFKQSKSSAISIKPTEFSNKELEREKEKERMEAERLEKERIAKEKERMETERLEKERIAKEKERMETERLEKERIAKEKERLEKEKERLEKERIEKERIEKDRLEKDRLEKDRLEKDRLEKEKDRLEKEKDRLEKEKEKAPFIVKEGHEPASQEMIFECEIEEIPDVDDKFFDKKPNITKKEATLNQIYTFGQKVPSASSGILSNYSQNDNLLNKDKNIEKHAKTINIFLDKPGNKPNEPLESGPNMNDDVVPPNKKPQKEKASEPVIPTVKSERKKEKENEREKEKEITQKSKPAIIITNKKNPEIEQIDTQEVQYGTNDKLIVSDCDEEKEESKEKANEHVNIEKSNKDKEKDEEDLKKKGSNDQKMIKKTIEKPDQSGVVKKDQNAKIIAEEVSKIIQSSTESKSSKNFDRSKFIKLGSCEKKEKHYNEVIHDFAGIFKEKNYLFLRRRLAFLKDMYFSSHILKENNIIDFKKKLHINYPKLLEESLQMYEEKQEFNSLFHEVIGHDNNNMAEVIELLEKPRHLENVFLIGGIRDMRYFSEKFNLTKESNLQELERAVGDFAYWREISCDGDSFYRGFMFALLENYIFQENFHEIKKLIHDIYTIYESPDKCSLFKSKAVDFRKVLVIFYLIIDNIQNRHCAKSYDVLIKAYHLEDKSFDNVLIAYMRYVIWSKTDELESMLQVNKRSAQGKNPVKKSYTSASMANQEYDEININTVICFQNEPVKLAMSAIPFLFNVNLEIYYLDGSIKMGIDKKNSLTYSSAKFTDNTMNDLPVISLCYHLSSYSRVYPRSFSETAMKILKPEIEELNSNNSLRYDKNVLVPGEEAQCEKCGKLTRLVFLTKYSYMACLLCLKNYVTEIIENRVIIYSKENFINREYYCRPIELKEKVYLNDYDISIIFDTNIANLLLTTGKNLCFSCDKIFKGDLDIYKLDCQCQFCKECLIKYHTEATKGYDYLNKFERKYVDKIPCCCNLPFNVENSFTLLQLPGKVLKDNARNRLDRIVSCYCMRCLQCVVQEGDEINVDSTRALPYHRFKIRVDSNQNQTNPEINRGSQRSQQRSQRTIPEPVEVNNAINEGNNNTEVSRVDHVLCEPCIEKLLRHESAEIERSKKNQNDVKPVKSDNNAKIVQCKICDADHFIERSDWNSMFKKSCCSDCMIY